MSHALLALTLVAAPWYWVLLTVPLSFFNTIRYKQKDHKLHFLTKREYKKDFKRMELQYQVKSGVYGVLLVGSLICTIISATDWLSDISRKRKA